MPRERKKPARKNKRDKFSFDRRSKYDPALDHREKNELGRENTGTEEKRRAAVRGRAAKARLAARKKKGAS